MKEVSLNPSEIIRAIKIARNTFGTFDFTYVPEAILEGERLTSFMEAILPLFSLKWQTVECSSAKQLTFYDRQ
jgi:hypothetical protein